MLASQEYSHILRLVHFHSGLGIICPCVYIKCLFVPFDVTFDVSCYACTVQRDDKLVFPNRRSWENKHRDEIFENIARLFDAFFI